MDYNQIRCSRLNSGQKQAAPPPHWDRCSMENRRRLMDRAADMDMACRNLAGVEGAGADCRNWDRFPDRRLDRLDPCSSQ